MTNSHRVLVTLSLSLLLGASAFAQKTEKLWLDNSLKSCKKSKATHYITMGEAVNDSYAVTLHRMDGSVKMEGISKKSDGSVLDGKSSFFHPNGQLESQGAYMAGKKVGLWERWDKYGKPLAERSYASFDPSSLAYTYVDIMPNFEGGEEKFRELLKHQISSHVTEDRLGDKEYQVSFVISEEGDIQGMKMRDGDEEIANEQLSKVFRQMKRIFILVWLV